MAVTALNRTLEQEVLALARGASLECPACGEFVLWTEHGITCPECCSELVGEAGEEAGQQLRFHAG